LFVVVVEERYRVVIFVG